jgi:uncharacterized SAM-binding protein YcdF (DUF218 family)
MVVGLSIPLQLAIARTVAPQPQAILTLGGHNNREWFTAYFARNHPRLEIWLSSGLSAQDAIPIFQTAGIPPQRLRFDRRAIDTVTNFTTLVKDFQHQHIRHLYLITSDYHMPRAQAIAWIVLGSHGIAVTPMSVPSNKPPESQTRIWRDVGRSILWVFTRQTGAQFSDRAIYQPNSQSPPLNHHPS